MMDEIISKLLASVAALTASTDKNNALLERVVAGQEKAMASLEGRGTSTAAKPGRPARADKPAPEPEKPEPASEPSPTPAPVHPLLSAPKHETAKNAKGEDAPTPNYRALDFSPLQVRNEFVGWLSETDDPDVRKDRAGFVAQIAQHFGVGKPFDPATGIKDPEYIKQTLFFLRRKREGLKVDFSADYDFDGDPLADLTTDVPATEDDPLG